MMVVIMGSVIICILACSDNFPFSYVWACHQ